MMFLRTIGLACLVYLSAVVSSLSAEPGEKFSAPLRAWDTIVSPTLFADIANFDRDIRHEAGERLYAFQTFDAAGKLLLSVAIAIAPAGSRLPQDEWKAAAANADPTMRARDFPEIGARARAEAPRFSPDGALSGVTFTTSDEFFDVVVSVFEESSSIVHPPLTAEDAARRIEAAYRATQN